MIYASSSIVINASAAHLWGIMEKFLSESSQGQYITNCTVEERYYDGFIRSLSVGAEQIKERVFLLKEQNKIITRLEDHPLLIGDTIYQIVTPDNPELSERKVTLSIVIAWRMRTGIIEAPRLNKKILTDDLSESIKAITEERVMI
jgi:hypothetical protein